MQARDQLIAMARQDPNLALVRPNGLNDNPTYKIDIDREKASAFGVNLSDVDQTFSIAWGSQYVNNFLDTDGRIKKVYVQADAPFRMNPEDLRSLYVRNTKGGMVPFTSFANGTWSYGSPKLERYNGVSVGRNPGAGGAGQEHGAGDGRDGAADAEAARRASATNGPASRCRNSSRDRRRRCFTGFRFSWCSSASPRCTRAGRCRFR